MASVTPVMRGREGRLLGSETKSASSDVSQDAEIDQAAMNVRVAHQRCRDLAAQGETRSAHYAEAVADRSEAVRVLRDTPASSFYGVRVKRELLLALKDWIGQEDPDCCEFAFQVADEAVRLIDLNKDEIRQESMAHGSRPLTGPGRWLMGAAVSVPAYLVNRFGLG